MKKFKNMEDKIVLLIKEGFDMASNFAINPKNRLLELFYEK